MIKLDINVHDFPLCEFFCSTKVLFYGLVHHIEKLDLSSFALPWFWRNFFQTHIHAYIVRFWTQFMHFIKTRNNLSFFGPFFHFPHLFHTHVHFSLTYFAKVYMEDYWLSFNKFSELRTNWLQCLQMNINSERSFSWLGLNLPI